MKAMRHAMILEIIDTMKIETQEELAAELRRRGVNVTQATVSRDIKELRLLKVLSEDGSYRYATAERAEQGVNDRLIRIFNESILSIAGAGNLIVLKTLTGSASAAAEAVDGFQWPEIIGTIAGDNTILVIVKNIEDVDDIISRFHEMIGNRR